MSIPRSPSGSGSSSDSTVRPWAALPLTISIGSLSSCSRVWGSPSTGLYCTFRGSASCSSFQKSEDGVWRPHLERQYKHIGIYELETCSHPDPKSTANCRCPGPPTPQAPTHKPPAHAPRSQASKATESRGGGAGAGDGEQGAWAHASGPRR